MALGGRSVFDNPAEVKVLFRCIRLPAQQTKEKRRQTRKSRESGKDLSEQACERCFRCGRTR